MLNGERYPVESKAPRLYLGKECSSPWSGQEGPHLRTFEWELKEARKKTLWLSEETLPGRKTSKFQGSKAVPWLSSPRNIGVDSVDGMESLEENHECGTRKDTGTECHGRVVRLPVWKFEGLWLPLSWMGSHREVLRQEVLDLVYTLCFQHKRAMAHGEINPDLTVLYHMKCKGSVTWAIFSWGVWGAKNVELKLLKQLFFSVAVSVQTHFLLFDWHVRQVFRPCRGSVLPLPDVQWSTCYTHSPKKFILYLKCGYKYERKKCHNPQCL